MISRHAEGAIEAHDVRTRHAGRVTFIDFHLVVPAQMTVADAHDICDRIEAALKEAVEGAHVTIHVEPEQKAKRRRRRRALTPTPPHTIRQGRRSRSSGSTTSRRSSGGTARRWQSRRSQIRQEMPIGCQAASLRGSRSSA